MTLTFSVPLPPRELSPNARVHWTARSAASREYKEWVTAIARLHRSGCWWLSGAKVHLTFVLPDHRRRDLDNLIARSKPLIDALGPWHEVCNKKGETISAYGADILADDNIETVSLTYSARVEAKVSRVDVEIEA